MIELLLFCLGTASLALFLEMCMDRGMILHWYYKLIERLPEVLFKPLGGCIYCASVWLYIIISGIVNYKKPLTPEFIGLFLVGAGLQYIFIKAIEKYVV